MDQGEERKDSGKNPTSKNQQPINGSKVNVLNFRKKYIAAVVLTILLILVWFSTKIANSAVLIVEVK